MLRQILELVPFGQDDSARRIAVMYLGNIGRTENGKDGECDYFIGYYETPSYFSGDIGIRRFKFVNAYNRNNPSFALLGEIYSKEGWLTGLEVIKDPKYSDYIDRIIGIMDTRAEGDIKWIK